MMKKVILNFRQATVTDADTKKEVGYLDVTAEKGTTPKSVLGYFDGDPKVERLLKDLRVPKTFTYFWIETLRINAAGRGKGYGSAVFHALHDPKVVARPALLALQAAEISRGESASSLTDLKKFYGQNIGFTLFRSAGGVYAFKMLK